MTYRGFIDPPESCHFGCAHEGPGSCRPCAHEFSFYPLAPELAKKKRAEFLGVCDGCGTTKYVDELPEGAKLGGEANA